MRYRLTLLILFASVLIPFVINCGKKADPLPPIVIAPERAGQPRVRQSGDKMIYFFQMPVYNTEGGGLADVEKIVIYRLKDARIPISDPTQTQTAPTQNQTQTQSQPQSQTQTQTLTAPQTQVQTQPELHTHTQTAPQTQTQTESSTQTQTQTGQTQTSQTQTQSQTAPVREEEAREIGDADFESRGEKFVELSREQIDGYLRDSTFMLVDTVNLQEGSEDLQNWFYYGAKVYNQKGKTAGFSKFAALFPAVVPNPPSNFIVKLAEKEMEITWNAVTTDVAGKPVTEGTVRYNIYRGTHANFAPEEPINTEPLDATTYRDTTFEFGKAYYYFIRAHYSNKKRQQESAPSNVVLIYPQDTFAPKAPEELNVVSAREGMVLIWAPNSEEDVVGYNIYRSTTEGSDYQKINPELIRETTFTDRDIKQGQRYYYVITAVDSAPVPNESEKSNETSEVAKAQ
jgi:hypothetical protein